MTMIIRRANVNCPKCGHPFVVRQQTETQMNSNVSPETEAALGGVWAAFDKTFELMDDVFKKVFKPKLRR